MNKHNKPSLMKKIKQLPLTITAAILLTIIIEALYLYHFITQGLLDAYGYSLQTLTNFEHWAILSFLLALITASMILITYGAIKRRQWTRKFMMIFLTWALILPLWAVIIQHQILLNLLLIDFFLVILAILHSSHGIIDYFGTIYRYGNYTLYKRPVQLRSGREIVIHFFSKKTPKSGTPTNLPNRYMVRVNDRSKMPYLVKRIAKTIYTHGDYTLYKRTVKLKSGRTVTIHFFSKKKPKSGTPTPLPQHFKVKINQRSKMPYLKKTAH